MTLGAGLCSAAVLLAACTGAVTPSDASGTSARPASTATWQAAAGVTVLSKADGWRPQLAAEGEMLTRYVVVEIAYDAASAQAAWEQNRPATDPVRAGAPALPGTYGTPKVDDPNRLVVVFSSGASGSCPGVWLQGIETRADKTVLLAMGADHANTKTCTADYRPYRMVLQVDRRLLPAEADLPTGHVLMDGMPVTPEASPVVARYPLSQSPTHHQ